MATRTKVFPVDVAPNGLPIGGLAGVPHVAHEVETKAEAEALVASGHFTLTPPTGRSAASAPAEPDTTDKE